MACWIPVWHGQGDTARILTMTLALKEIIDTSCGDLAHDQNIKIGNKYRTFEFSGARSSFSSCAGALSLSPFLHVPP